MAITIGSNIAALNGIRQLEKSTNRLTQSYERLSSGQRINRARDDAAGLAIAEVLRADQRIAGVAIRNANDGISAVAIVDAAMGEIGNVLARLGELAEQSANGVYSSTQRSALQSEFAALGSEIERIALTTEFNGVRLLSGGANIVFQVGFNSQSTSQVTFNGVQATLASLGLAAPNGASLSFSINDSTNTLGQSAALLALDAVKLAIGSLTQSRGGLGSTESRLGVAINTLSVAKENFAAAESRIRDVDVASEAAELTRLTILQQAGASILAQANQQPALALSLIQ
ncbi:MAG: flagellin [bacterium]|nr:flagellin [bacterium]